MGVSSRFLFLFIASFTVSLGLLYFYFSFAYPSNQSESSIQTGDGSGFANAISPALTNKVQKQIVNKNILQAREYSFKWNKTNLQPRSEKIESIFNLIKQVGGLQFLENGIENESGNISIRNEYGIQSFTKTCGTNPTGVSARVREYLRGYREGFYTLDIKGNYVHKEGGLPSSDKILDLAELPLIVQPDVDVVIDKLEEGLFFIEYSFIFFYCYLLWIRLSCL